MFKKRGLIIVIFLGCMSNFKAKADNSPVYADAGSWNTFSINYSLNKKFTFLFTEELRFRENYSRLNLFYTNLGVEYKLNKHFKTALVYRWINKFLDDNTFSFRHRLQCDATIKYPYKKFSFAYRHRLQVESRNIYTSESGKVPEWYSRSKFDISYSLNKKVTPNFSTEFRYQLHDPRNIESDNTWHRVRFQGGVDYQHSSQSKWGIYYLIQKEFNVSAAENIYITGIEYTISLK
jgi:hypothetical protein